MSDSPPSDPFAELKRMPFASDAPAPRSDGEPVMPVPADAPPRLETHKGHGRPTASWAYRDAGGQLLGYVARFDGADGSKVVLPLTLRRTGARLHWSWKGFPEPRPL